MSIFRQQVRREAAQGFQLEDDHSEMFQSEFEGIGGSDAALNADRVESFNTKQGMVIDYACNCNQPMQALVTFGECLLLAHNLCPNPQEWGGSAQEGFFPLLGCPRHCSSPRFAVISAQDAAAALEDAKSRGWVGPQGAVSDGTFGHALQFVNQMRAQRGARRWGG